MINFLILMTIGSLGLAGITDASEPDNIFGYLLKFGLEGLFIGFAGFCFWKLVEFFKDVFIPRLDSMIQMQEKIADKTHDLKTEMIELKIELKNKFTNFPCIKGEK